MKFLSIILSSMGGDEVAIILFTILILVGVIVLCVKNMKAGGIVLIVMGALSTIGALIGASQGHQTSFGGLAFIVIGAFLLSRANKKKEEEEKKKEWENQSPKDDENKSA